MCTEMCEDRQVRRVNQQDTERFSSQATVPLRNEEMDTQGEQKCCVISFDV